MTPSKVKFVGDNAGTPGQRICPGCHMSVSGSGNFCYHCRHFIDWNQNRVLDPSEVPDEALEQLLRTTQAAANAFAKSKQSTYDKKGKILMIVGGILCLTLILFIPGIVMFLAGLMMFLSSDNRPTECMAQSDISDVAAQTLVPPLLEQGFDSVQEYRHDKVFSARLLLEAQLMQQAYNNIGGTDYIRAVYRGVSVELGDVELSNTQHKGASLQKSSTVFKGLMMVCYLNHPLPEPVVIWEREGRAPMGDGVGTGDPAFDSKFYVESRHPETARQVLTPQLIRFIETLDSVGDGQTSLRFAEDGRLFVMIATAHDLFEIRRFDEPVASIRARYTDELQRILDLISIAALTPTAAENSSASPL